MMGGRLQRFFVGSQEVSGVVAFRFGLAAWTLCYWAPRLPHAAELYARPFMRWPGPLGKLLGSPLPPAWLVTSLVVVLMAACIGVIFSQRPRRYHLVVLGCFILLHAFDTMMVRAYGNIAYYAWWLLLLAPYDQLRESNGAIREGPVTGQRLLGVQFSAVYLITGLAKLRAGERWMCGESLWIHLHGSAQGDWLLSHWVDFPLWLCQIGAWGTITAELFIAVGLWFGRTRRYAMWAVLLLHLSMTLTLRVSWLFPSLMILHLCLFVPDEVWARWRAKRRPLSSAPGSR